MGSFLTLIPTEGDGHAYCCALIGRINLKLASDQFHSLLHAGDTDTSFEPGLVFPPRHTGRGSAARVADFQREIRITIKSYLGSLASRVTLDVGEALLYHTE